MFKIEHLITKFIKNTKYDDFIDALTSKIHKNSKYFYFQITFMIFYYNVENVNHI